MRQIKLLALAGILVALAACYGKEQQTTETSQTGSQPSQASAPAGPDPYAPPSSQQQPPATSHTATPAASHATPPASSPPTTGRMMEVPAGTVLMLALDSTLDSKTSQTGDPFTATVVETVQVQGREAIPEGATVHGTVTEAVPAPRGAGQGKLTLAFDSLRLPGGYQTPMRGTFQEVSESKKKRNAAVIGGSAAGGALLGRILGKDTKGAVIGTIVGGGIGTAVVMGKQGAQATLPADTPFEILLEDSVSVPEGRRSSASRPSSSAASTAAAAPAAASPAQATAPAPEKAQMVSVPAQTVLSLALDTGLSSKTAQVGDTFTATVLEPILVDNAEAVPAGSKIEGKVIEAVAARRGGGNAKLGLSFDLLKLQGFQTNIVGSFQEVTESKKKRNAAVIGGSAAGGALLGRILGKDTKGAVIGSIIGGGIGTAVVMGKEGRQADLPADTPFEIKLEEAVQVPKAPSGS